MDLPVLGKPSIRISIFFVVAILVAKFFEHHLFFGATEKNIKRNEQDNTSESCDPILNQKNLRDNPCPLTCVHWMAYVMINPIRDERMCQAPRARTALTLPLKYDDSPISTFPLNLLKSPERMFRTSLHMRQAVL